MTFTSGNVCGSRERVGSSSDGAHGSRERRGIVPSCMARYGSIICILTLFQQCIDVCHKSTEGADYAWGRSHAFWGRRIMLAAGRLRHPTISLSLSLCIHDLYQIRPFRAPSGQVQFDVISEPCRRSPNGSICYTRPVSNQTVSSSTGPRFGLRQFLGLDGGLRICTIHDVFRYYL